MPARHVDELLRPFAFVAVLQFTTQVIEVTSPPPAVPLEHAFERSGVVQTTRLDAQ